MPELGKSFQVGRGPTSEELGLIRMKAHASGRLHDWMLVEKAGEATQRIVGKADIPQMQALVSDFLGSNLYFKDDLEQIPQLPGIIYVISKTETIESML